MLNLRLQVSLAGKCPSLHLQAAPGGTRLQIPPVVQTSPWGASPLTDSAFVTQFAVTAIDCPNAGAMLSGWKIKYTVCLGQILIEKLSVG